jgi:hypothetical protein
MSMRANSLLPLILLTFAVFCVSGCWPFSNDDDASPSIVQSNPSSSGYSDTRILNVSKTFQHTQSWCWAASEQSALSAYGIMISQERIVTFTYGYLVDSPATTAQIQNGLYINGISSQLTGALSLEQIKANIRSGNPIIMFYTGSFVGHFVVLYGFNGNNIYIFDPIFGSQIAPYTSTFYYNGGNNPLYWTQSIVMSGPHSNG